MVDSPLTTLWEGWGIGGAGFGGGSYNHAWSGGPLTIMSQYIAGIAPLAPAFSEFGVRPDPAHLSHIHAIVPLSGGREIGFRLERDARECVIVLALPQRPRAHFFVPAPYTRVWANGEERQAGTDGLTLQPGRWDIVLR